MFQETVTPIFKTISTKIVFNIFTKILDRQVQWTVKSELLRRQLSALSL